MTQAKNKNIGKKRYPRGFWLSFDNLARTLREIIEGNNLPSDVIPPCTNSANITHHWRAPLLITVVLTLSHCAWV